MDGETAFSVLKKFKKIMKKLLTEQKGYLKIHMIFKILKICEGDIKCRG